MSDFVDKLVDFGKWIDDNKDNLTWLIGVIAGITVALRGLGLASAIFGTISLLTGGLVVALGALVGALVVAYTKSETFRNIVNAAFEAVKKVVMDIIDNLVAYYKI